MTSTNRRNLDLMSRCAEEVGTTLDKVKVGVRCSRVTATLRLPTASLTCCSRPCVLVCRIGSVLKQWRENVRRAFYPDPSLSSRGWVLFLADHRAQSTCLSFRHSTSPEVQSSRPFLHHQQRKYGGWMATTYSSLSTYSNTPSWDQVCVKYLHTLPLLLVLLLLVLSPLQRCTGR